jgi:hypothetical protein
MKPIGPPADFPIPNPPRDLDAGGIAFWCASVNLNAVMRLEEPTRDQVVETLMQSLTGMLTAIEPSEAALLDKFRAHLLLARHGPRWPA